MSTSKSKDAERAEGDAKDLKLPAKSDPVDDDLPFDDDLHLPLPPDGGWGWMVAIACFLTNLIVDGTCYTFSVIYNEVLEYFDAGKAETALVGALLPGVYLLVGKSLNVNSDNVIMFKIIDINGQMSNCALSKNYT